jgi:hypothetical protein
VRKRRCALGAGVVLAGLGLGAAETAQPDASSQQRASIVSFAAYVAAFNSESSANQIRLASVGTSAHLSRAVALKHALRQEPKAVVLGSGLGTFKAAFYHYKPVPVWVVAVDPRGSHRSAGDGGPGSTHFLRYNYVVIVEAARTGAQIEEAQGWDSKLPPLPPEEV